MKPKPNSTMNLIKRATQLLTVVLVLSIMSIVVHAETLDDQTPAEEGVCDPLKADGVTKGLYGLCVAFCEAQDFASVDVPLTEKEILALLNDRPSGKILENYNKRKTETDPEMPCIVPKPDSQCSCFTEEEIMGIDGKDRPRNLIPLLCHWCSRMTPRSN